MGEYPLAIGNDITLIAGFQLMNNARVTFLGSLDFLSNHMSSFKSAVLWDEASHKMERYANANQKFLQHFGMWNFNYSGRLRVTSIRHRLADGTRNEFYYIN